MRRLYAELGGEKDRVIAAYAALDHAGEAPRKRKGSQSAFEYARRLWYNGVYHGWLSENPPPRSPRAKPKKLEKSVRIDRFEEALATLAADWLASPERPKLAPDCIAHWNTLIEQWILAEDLPLLVRKGSVKGIARRHKSGREVIQCDNSPAHWSFMGCFAGSTPSLDDVRDQLARKTLPITMARSRDIARHLDDESYEVGGFLGYGEYGTPLKFGDGYSYKLCHIDGVGIGKKGSPESLDIQLLEDHMRRLLRPDNMFLIPQRYAGLGECEAFVQVFRQHRDLATSLDSE